MSPLQLGPIEILQSFVNGGTWSRQVGGDPVAPSVGKRPEAVIA